MGQGHHSFYLSIFRSTEVLWKENPYFEEDVDKYLMKLIQLIRRKYLSTKISREKERPIGPKGACSRALDP